MGNENNRPVSGYNARIDAHLVTLLGYWPKCVNAEEQINLIKWFLDGDLLGLQREDLLGVLHEHAELQDALSKLDLDAPTEGKHPPEFRSGDPVEVIVNAKNLTHHIGTVREAVWHFKDRRWNYYLEVSGKRIGKRYLANDLRQLRH